MQRRGRRQRSTNKFMTPTDHRSFEGRIARAALRGVAVRAVGGVRWHVEAASVGLLAMLLIAAPALAADSTSNSDGRWFWSKSKKSAQPELKNPFDERPASKTPPQSSQKSSAPRTETGLAQPTFLEPSPEPGTLPWMGLDAGSGVPSSLVQPKWMRPQAEVVITDEPAIQEVAISDAPSHERNGAPQADSNATASAKLQQPVKVAHHKPAPNKTNQQTPAPAWAGLVQGLAGTNATANVEPTPDKSALESAGGELARQVTGVGTPITQPPPGASIANQAYPMTATPMESLSLFPGASNPTTRVTQTAAAMSAESAKATPSAKSTPDANFRPQAAVAVNSNDPTASLWTQMGFAPETPVKQTSATSPVAAGTSVAPPPPQESIFSALWRPVAMSRNSPEVERPSSANSSQVAEAKSKSGKKTKPRPESETVPDLLKPFYATNAEAGQSRGSKSSKSSDSLPITKPLESSLAQQLMLSSDAYLQAPDAEPAVESFSTDPGLAAAAVVNQWSTLSNPLLLSQQPYVPVAANGQIAAAPGGVGGDARQVSFLQDEDTLPEPNRTLLNGDDIDLPGDDTGDDDEDADGKGDGDETDSLTGADQLGSAPEDNTLEFLRTQTVLLKPGDMQFDIGFQYTLQENDFPILLVDGSGDVVGIDEVEFRGRELTVPMEIRYGLLKRVQTFLQVPVGWSNTQVSIDGVDIFDNDGGIGDIGFGLTAQLCDATKDRPYMIGTLSAVAPTGGDPFTGIIGFSPSAPSLGNGFWQLAGNLLWIETRYDPVILFYGFGTRYQFSHRYIGVEFQPGPEYNYTLGYGFAVNERVTLSTQFFGAYQEELKANGERLEGTNLEPMNIQLAATFINRCDRIVEPFVTFGLTDDSISSNFGITWTY
jgi:hypothetical protein